MRLVIVCVIVNMLRSGCSTDRIYGTNMGIKCVILMSFSPLLRFYVFDLCFFVMKCNIIDYVIVLIIHNISYICTAISRKVVTETIVNCSICANKLSLNLIKTEYILIGSRHNINNILATPKVFVGDIPIKRVRETKALGIYIDEFLSWEKHIDKIAKKVSSGIGAIRKLKPCVDRNTLICAYNALVLPHLDYCCEVWDTIGTTLSDRLQKLQNRAARAIVGRKNEHGQSELALNELNWKPLSERRTQFVASLMYKITHDLAPLRLTDIFQKTSSSQHYNLRGSSTKLHLPKPKTEYLKKSLSYRGAKLWNSLPNELRQKESLAIFNINV